MTGDRLCALLWAQYGLRAAAPERPADGAGGDTFFVTCGDRRLVVKFPEENGMNHPGLEPPLCAWLRERGVPACRFLPNLAGEYLSRDGDGRAYHVQAYVPGTVYGLNEAPDWLLTQAAGLLGRIHTALADYPALPEGIGQGFLTHMTPERAGEGYALSLELARQRGDAAAEEDLRYRMDLVTRLPAPPALGRLSCRNTHGDYGISQLVCGQGTIRAVIDWTVACVHPCVWELIRSYVYAAPTCRGGQVDIPGFLRYLRAYLEATPLGRDDLALLPALFRYQLAVSDYYGQYFRATTANRQLFRHQAAFSTALLRWFDGHLAEFEAALAAVKIPESVKKSG